MTGIILNGLQQDNFSWLRFSIARARRIVPALTMLLFLLLAVGLWWLPPLAYNELATQAAYSQIFLSNVLFWSTAGYFDSAAHEKWLLHTWSLSVEMQFYLLFPLLLVTCWKFFPNKTRLIRHIILLLMVLSLSACLQLYQTRPAIAFYWLPMRSWELLAGAAIYSLSHSQQPPIKYANTLFFIGIILVGLGLLAIDSGTAWPSPMAILPVAGTGLIILAQRSHSRLFKHSVQQWLGNISYSLYLWHWPLVVWLNYLNLDNHWLWIIAGITASLVFAQLSYKLVEVPTRTHFVNIGWKKQALTLTVMTLPVLIFATIDTSRHMPTNAAPFFTDKNTWFDEECFINEHGQGKPFCNFGGDRTRAYLLGDSHALALRPAFEVTLQAWNPEFGFVFSAMSGCPTISDALYAPHSLRPPQLCKEHNEQLLTLLQNNHDNHPVVLLSRTSLAALGPNETKEEPQPFMTFANIKPEDFPRYFQTKLVETACEIAKSHPVYLVRPIPEIGVNVPRTLEKQQLHGNNQDIRISLLEYHTRNSIVWHAQNMAREKCGIHILDPLPYLCDQEYCYGSRNGVPLYFDGDHLNQHGSSLLVPMFAQIFTSTNASQH